MSEEPIEPIKPIDPIFAQAPPTTVITDATWESAIAEWVSNHLRNSPLSEHAPGWNHVMGSISALRGILENALKSQGR